MKKIFLLLALSLFSSLSKSQTEVNEYKPGITVEGITYFLPVTKVHFVLHATRTKHIAGEYAAYAERYLRMANVPVQDYDDWVLNSVDAELYGEADTSKAYSIKLKAKTSAPYVGLTPDGRLLTINCNENAAPDPKLTIASKKLIKKAENLGVTHLTEDIIAASSKQKMAQNIANEIYDIRESRNALSKGQADYMPSDGEQLKLMLKNLDEQEAALLSLFTGAEEVEEYVLTFDYSPEKAVDRDILFRFSRFFGLVDKENLSGEPVYITITPQTQNVSTENEVSGKEETPNLRYMVPAKTLVKVEADNKTLFERIYAMAQFGRVEKLGSELFNKKNTTHVILSPILGSITKISAEEK